jgi:hypothetical protein
MQVTLSWHYTSLQETYGSRNCIHFNNHMFTAVVLLDVKKCFTQLGKLACYIHCQICSCRPAVSNLLADSLRLKIQSFGCRQNVYTTKTISNTASGFAKCMCHSKYHMFMVILYSYVESKQKYTNHGDANIRKAKDDTENIKRLKCGGDAIKHTNI